ncbi:MAG TPA: chemotaxis protein CheW [Cyanobacteria bacterium UBA8543]|nr:chemotaxis protein CheW [Cyanobacteria bacterium UBA8543]
MENKQYLTFSSQNLHYGIEAALVQEIFPIPELTPIVETFTNIIGIINLREQTVPIMHLDLLQGHPLKGCHFSDYVIIMQCDDLQMGLVVHQLDEVLELNTEVIETEPSTELICDINPAFIAGVYQGDYGNIILLNLKTLVRQLDAVLPLIWDAQMQLDIMAESSNNEVEQQLEQELSQQNEELQMPQITSSFFDLYCPDATPEERAIFRQRADNIRKQTESLKVTNKLMPMAVISLSNQYFGLDLELVRAFTNISNLTPIPCCPNHIVGNMNLRGEIVTLVDIRNVLNLPTTPISVGSPAVVVQVDDIVAGLPVDQVLEMTYLNPTDMTSLSGILSDFGEQYLQGTAFFQEKMLNILDLPKILTQGKLAVNEEV